MADNGEQEETAPRGNEWEVVSLTASAYAAAPHPKQVVSSNDNVNNLGGENEAELSRAMFMSSHFVFPPSQHENLPLESEYNEILQERGGEDDGPNTVAMEGSKSDAEDIENTSIRGLMADEFPGNHVFDDKGNRLPVSGSDLENYMDSDELQSIYNTTEFSSLYSEATPVRSTTVEDLGADDVIQPSDHSSDSGLSNFQKPLDKNKADLPCEAWWKRRAVSLYAHAKETNTVWSIFIAAAVMGLVILGNRWQVLCLKWQFSINDERMVRLLGPLSRFKDLIVGGQRQGSLIRRGP
ncbi:ATG8-interacting protein 1-like [Olea europaea var. sylvestris]|uniref:ATG8-interacting protein 1-like n=1 Tax=Olea europaea var. sylvestris TaxID=158386 RepID=UPI000C1D890F|nr:ATG8-interacting protein 1-like [Olea europaea var. sylvestris]XP_022886698.1 ATG8-interacting protein 1-like [Olea europaea var. sylvestris]XP_022886699.1 ATG8-interacting protein 1-like [Olea europaea var. sylvestris]